MEGKRGSECPLKSVSNIDFNPQCGNKCIVDSQRLQKGFTRSCGCLRSEISRSNIKANNQTKKYMGNPKNFQLINRTNLVASTLKRSNNKFGMIGIS